MAVDRRFHSILAEAVSRVDALAQLRRDRGAVRHEIEEVLRRYAAKHGIHPDEVRLLSYGYVDDIVGDLFVDMEEQLDREFEELTALCGAAPDLPAPR